jgi:hypothetical protein
MLSRVLQGMGPRREAAKLGVRRGAADLGDVPQIESRPPFAGLRSGGHRLVAPC